jgi:hypothetical protein
LTVYLPKPFQKPRDSQRYSRVRGRPLFGLVPGLAFLSEL